MGAVVLILTLTRIERERPEVVGVVFQRHHRATAAADGKPMRRHLRVEERAHDAVPALAAVVDEILHVSVPVDDRMVIRRKVVVSGRGVGDAGHRFDHVGILGDLHPRLDAMVVLVLMAESGIDPVLVGVGELGLGLGVVLPAEHEPFGAGPVIGARGIDRHGQLPELLERPDVAGLQEVQVALDRRDGDRSEHLLHPSVEEPRHARSPGIGAVDEHVGRDVGARGDGLNGLRSLANDFGDRRVGEELEHLKPLAGGDELARDEVGRAEAVERAEGGALHPIGEVGEPLLHTAGVEQLDLGQTCRPLHLVESLANGELFLGVAGVEVTVGPVELAGRPQGRRKLRDLTDRPPHCPDVGGGSPLGTDTSGRTHRCTAGDALGFEHGHLPVALEQFVSHAGSGDSSSDDTGVSRRTRTRGRFHRDFLLLESLPDWQIVGTH